MNMNMVDPLAPLHHSSPLVNQALHSRFVAIRGALDAAEIPLSPQCRLIYCRN